MSVKFTDAPYFCSHGKAPRGYGSWAFKVDGEADPRFAHGKFADARKAVKAQVAAAQVDKNRVVYVSVCP